ncbi:MAG TPA: hypothetical protein V6C96_05510 [Vampirovibrionales bacterium]
MDSFLSTPYSLVKLTAKNRNFLADHLIKSNAPNAKDLCTHELDFRSIVSDIEDKESGASEENIDQILNNHTKTVPVTGSPRELVADMSQAYMMNIAALRLMRHTVRQNKAAMDNFRPA